MAPLPRRCFDPARVIAPSSVRLALLAALFLAIVAAPALRVHAAGGAVSLVALESPVFESFDTLNAAGTVTWVNDGTIPGWYHARTGTGNTLVANNGGSNAGNLYSYGTGTSADRALGSVGSGNAAAGNFHWGVRLANDTGATITSLTVSYAGEQWRNGGAAAQTADFSYIVGAGLGGSLSDFTSGGTPVPELSFTSPVTAGSAGALDGNAVANRVAISHTIAGLSLPPGGEILLRWADVDHAGADHGLAIDDLVVTAHGGAGPPSISIDDVSVTEGNSGTMTATFTVTASTAAHPGITFDVATADGTGPTPATVADFDYIDRVEIAQFIPSGTTTYSFGVTVNGDLAVEPTEIFFVNVTNVSGAVVADGQGVGTIVNDDAPPPVVGDIVISQVYGGGGNAGATYTNDFVELFNRGTSTVNVSGWSVQYSSASGTSWQVTTLAGSIAPGKYFLVEEGAGSGGTTALPAPDASGAIAMSATGGKILLRSSNAANTGACPIDAVDFVGYGGANCFEGSAPTLATSNTTAALRKRGGCYESDNNGTDFSVGAPSPRNSALPARSCVPITAEIHDIQGNGAATPLAGQDVVTSGIVTGVKSNGFFLQAPAAAWDVDPLTSEAIFIFTGATPAVSAGDEVAATGTASEFFDLTQLDSSLPGDVMVTSSGGLVPAPLVLTPAILDPTGTPDQLERFEAMRVHAPGFVSVAPTNNFGETSTVLVGVPRPMREPGIEVSLPVPPDPTSGVPDCCIPRWDQNPERIVVDSDGLVGAPVVSVTSNVLFSAITGPLDFTFSEYKVLPEAPPATSANMSGIAVPEPDADELTVGGFNIENFNNDETQRRKAALAIRQLMRSPDIIGHIEIFNLASLQALANQVNSDAVAAGEPSPGYEAALVPSPVGTQNLGFLVKTSRVQIDAVTQVGAGETYVNPVSGMSETLHDRPPLVLNATFDPFGPDPRPVIVVVNHLRSFIDIELVGGDGARVRAKRTAQAESVASLLQSLQAANPDTPVIAVGDYNAYQFNDGYTDPIAVIKGTPRPDEQVVVDQSPDLVDPNFINLVDALPAAEQYSFIFEGTPQALDHVLLNTVAAQFVTDFAIARGNADFPEVPAALFHGDVTRPESSSDHDMPVAYFRFPPPPPPAPPTALIRGGVTINGSSLVEGSIQVTTGANVTFNGSATLGGNLLIVGTPIVTVNGHPTFGGVVDGGGSASPTGHRATINGGSTLGFLVRRTDAVPLPAVAPPPASSGTRSVVINKPTDSPGDFATVRDLTLNGNAGAVAVPPGTYRAFTANGNSAFILGVAGSTTPAVYNFESLTLNGNSTLQVVGPVIVTVKNALALNGSAGSAAHPEWLTLRVANGGVTLNGSVSLYAYVEAPNGTLAVNGGTQLVGGAAAGGLTLNGSGRLLLRMIP